MNGDSRGRPAVEHGYGSFYHEVAEVVHNPPREQQ